MFYLLALCVKFTGLCLSTINCAIWLVQKQKANTEKQNSGLFGFLPDCFRPYGRKIGDQIEPGNEDLHVLRIIIPKKVVFLDDDLVLCGPLIFFL
ncbi:MAG: hypothetical protein AB2L24_15150 [Mangrovibacterium sp.]